MSRYSIQSGELAEQNERDRFLAKLDENRIKRERFAPAFPTTDAEPLVGVRSMFAEEWAERLPLIQAFVRQGFIWQWFGDRRGWAKVTDTDFAARVDEYSETWTTRTIDANTNDK